MRIRNIDLVTDILQLSFAVLDHAITVFAGRIQQRRQTQNTGAGNNAKGAINRVIGRTTKQTVFHAPAQQGSEKNVFVDTFRNMAATYG